MEISTTPARHTLTMTDDEFDALATVMSTLHYNVAWTLSARYGVKNDALIAVQKAVNARFVQGPRKKLDGSAVSLIINEG